LVDIAAKGGNYLLNVGPTAEGFIPEPSVERLKQMGDWLKINGEAIYATNSRKQYKEGDTKFTVSKDGKYTYAIVKAKSGNVIELTSVTPVEGSKIQLLGLKKPVKWTNEKGKLKITLPDVLPSEYGVILKMKN
jgi:alpha-L-fucosidase